MAELWEKSENELREVLKELDVPFYEAEGEAAFYGPKLDVQVKSAIGHDVTLSTIQLDYQLPERFELTYVDENSNKVRPVVIHRAILGSLDRFVAFLLEETKGILPLWLAPVQINVLPVNNKYHLDYSKEIYELLNNNNFKCELDSRDEKLSYRMREAQTRKIPCTLILGDKEKEENLISYRLFGDNKTFTLSKMEFIDYVKKTINDKK